MGVVIQDVSRALAQSFGLPEPKGALIAKVEKDGPAAKAGLQPSDIILKFNGRPVIESKDLPTVVAGTKPGTKVVVQIWRRGRTVDVPVVVGEMPLDKTAKNEGQAAIKTDRLGLDLAELTQEQKNQVQTDHGLVVTGVGEGPAAQVGIMRGDVILAVNDQNVESVSQFEKMIAGIPKGRDVALLVWRGGNSIFITTKID